MRHVVLAMGGAYVINWYRVWSDFLDWNYGNG